LKAAVLLFCPRKIEVDVTTYLGRQMDAPAASLAELEDAPYAWLTDHQAAVLTVLYSQNKTTTSNQPAVLFSQNKTATSNQPAVLFSQNKPAPAIRTNEHAVNLQQRRLYMQRSRVVYSRCSSSIFQAIITSIYPKDTQRSFASLDGQSIMWASPVT
jgi:hypothetical protein